MTFHDIVMVKGKAGFACLFLLFVLICGAAVSAEEESPPSLEFSPPSDEVVPEQAPVEREQVRALFTKSIGGFGISRESFDSPMDVAYDSEGNYYVLDAGNSRVQKFTSRDRFVLEWGSNGHREGDFAKPLAIATDSEDAVYVVDTGNNRIQKFDGDGELLLTWGELGNAPGKFIEPADIAFDEDGNVYVLDVGNNRIEKFNRFGIFEEQWGGFQGGRTGDFTDVVSISWADDRFGLLYLLGTVEEDCMVQVLRLKGGRHEVDSSWIVPYPEEDQGECSPARIEIDNHDDYVYILERERGVLNRFTKSGDYVDSIWEAEEPFLFPMGFAVRPRTREVWVADTGNNIVQRFSLR
jgi:hypothetical protein